MSTSSETLQTWFDIGAEDGKAYMLVFCDTYDHSDYPVYADTKEEAEARSENLNSMERLMEVYDLNADKASQFQGNRRVNALLNK